MYAKWFKNLHEPQYEQFAKNKFISQKLSREKYEFVQIIERDAEKLVWQSYNGFEYVTSIDKLNNYLANWIEVDIQDSDDLERWIESSSKSELAKAAQQAWFYDVALNEWPMVRDQWIKNERELHPYPFSSSPSTDLPPLNQEDPQDYA